MGMGVWCVLRVLCICAHDIMYALDMECGVYMICPSFTYTLHCHLSTVHTHVCIHVHDTVRSMYTCTSCTSARAHIHTYRKKIQSTHAQAHTTMYVMSYTCTTHMHKYTCVHTHIHMHIYTCIHPFTQKKPKAARVARIPIKLERARATREADQASGVASALQTLALKKQVCTMYVTDVCEMYVYVEMPWDAYVDVYVLD